MQGHFGLVTRGKGFVTLASQPDSDPTCCGTLTELLPNHSETLLSTENRGYFLESPAPSKEARGEPGNGKLNSREDGEAASSSQPQITGVLMQQFLRGLRRPI